MHWAMRKSARDKETEVSSVLVKETETVGETAAGRRPSKRRGEVEREWRGGDRHEEMGQQVRQEGRERDSLLSSGV